MRRYAYNVLIFFNQQLKGSCLENKRYCPKLGWNKIYRYVP